MIKIFAERTTRHFSYSDATLALEVDPFAPYEDISYSARRRNKFIGYFGKLDNKYFFKIANDKIRLAKDYKTLCDKIVERLNNEVENDK